MIPRRRPDMAELTRSYHKPEAIFSDREITKKVGDLTGKTVLDVGSGFGRDIKQIRNDFSGVTITALDYQQELLDLVNQADYKVLGDARQLPFADKSFDVAYCNGVLAELSEEDALQAIEELKRVAHVWAYSEIYKQEDGELVAVTYGNRWP